MRWGRETAGCDGPERGTRRNGGRLSTAFVAVVVAGAILAAADVGLFLQNQTLRHELAGGRRLLEPPIGRRVPPLEGIDALGKAQTVGYAGGIKPTFVFVFSSNCGICDQTWPQWTSMLASGGATHVRPVFVSTSRGVAPGFVEAHRIAPFPVFVELDPKVVVAYNMQLTPEVYEVSPRGVVTAAWLGGLDAPAAASLARALGSRNLRVARPPGK